MVLLVTDMTLNDTTKPETASNFQSLAAADEFIVVVGQQRRESQENTTENN